MPAPNGDPILNAIANADTCANGYSGLADRYDFRVAHISAGWPELHSYRAALECQQFAGYRKLFCQRRRAEPLDDGAPVFSLEPDPERRLSAQQRHDRLRAAVQELPVGLRQVLVLALEDISHAEIAAIVGISENNVAVRLSRARATLSRLLGVEERS